MLEMSLRQAATAVLQSAIRIAPPHAREWGQAMRRELSYVEGPWAAVRWALGGAGVMVKHALVSLFIPGRRQAATPGDEFSARHVSWLKAAGVAGTGCILAALLFFTAPPFRQALRVSLRPWWWALQLASGNVQPSFESLAKRAEAEHDPEGLAFCAVRLQNSRESARLAEEAVRLDTNLVWVYAVVGMRHPELSEVGPWVRRLERWDPENALFHLIEAESIGQAHSRRAVGSSVTSKQAWQDAMAAAFRSPKFDDYLDRVAQLIRNVVPRYNFYDPYEVESREELDLPVSAFRNSERFAQSLLHSGEDLEARGDRKGARAHYWAVARYGQLIDSQGHTGFEHWAGTTLQAMAYKQLQLLSQGQGRAGEALLYGYLAGKFDPVIGEHLSSPRERVFGQYISTRNARVFEISGLMIFIFSGLVVVGASTLIVARRRSARHAATMVVMTAAVGLLLSSATLYLTYRPYWYIFQGAILNGGRSQAPDLRDFLRAIEMPLRVAPGVDLVRDSVPYSGSPDVFFYFWTGVTALGVIGLVLIVLRRFLGRPRASSLEHIPRVP